jgi:hypothetical protein
MYGVFALVNSIETERAGYGAKMIQNTVGIEDEAAAMAVVAYMQAAFQAGRASSAAREREFCARDDISTTSDLVQALSERRKAHVAELDRLAEDISAIVSDGDYAKLTEYATQRQARTMLFGLDVEAMYAGESVNVASELQRRCE